MKNIRWFVVFLILFLMGAGVYAQNTQIGIIGGINMASLNIEDEGVDINNVMGMGVGCMLDFGFSENISWCFEPMYLQKGVHAKIMEEDSTIEQKMKFAYIEIPLFLKVSPGSGMVQPYVMAGASIGFLLSANVEISEIGQETRAGLKNYMRSIEYGVGLGGGINIIMDHCSLFIEGRYSVGLADVFKGGGIEIYGENNHITYTGPKNKGVQIMGGLCMPL